jgi:hypothetical protein
MSNANDESDSGPVAKVTGGIPRRIALKVIGTMPLAVTATGLEAAAPPARKPAAPAAASTAATKAAAGKALRFFTDHEAKTAGVLADLIIPRDEVSGSATEAGVVEFMDEWVDFWGERIQAQMRGGLMWLDAECTRRFDKTFVECTDAQRRQVLDRIAHPPKEPASLPGQPTQQRPEGSAASTYPQGPAPQKPGAGASPPETSAGEEGTSYSQGIAFFTLFRDLTASGFYTSEIGIKDLGFMGNQPYNWQGCPPEVLAKLGLA